MGKDDLSMRNIKQAANELLPLLLHLVNSVIKKTTFPQSLKTNKIIPIKKMEKYLTSSDGWRPVNVVNSLSKLIQRVMLGQLLQHLADNNLVGHQHHGSIRNRSTQ